MKQSVYRFLSSILLITIANCSLAATVENPEVLEAYIDGIVGPLMLNHNSPSGTVAISLHGKVLLAKGYGFEDVEKQVPVDPYATLFRPGSVSKLFTWVSIMQLVEQGKLDLDTDVNTYLESFKIKDTFKEPITLRHIMTHTSGFEDGALGYLIIDDPGKAIGLHDAMEKYQPERINPPGVQTAYSNYATALAGLIVENISGIAFNEYVDRNIFEPLGMNKSSFEEPLPEKLAGRMAKSYTAENGAFIEKPFEIISNFGPAGGLSSTSTDMIRFAQAMLNGGELDGSRILKPETVEQMLTRSFTQDDRLMGMLLGFYETDYSGNRVIGHGGDTQWFHSFLGIDRENDLAIFVSFGGPGGSTVRSAVTPALYREFFPRDEAPPTPPEDFSKRAERYAGTYAFWRANFSKIERAFGISDVVEVSPTENNTLTVAFGGGSKQYVEVDKNLFRELNSGFSLIAGISPRQIAFQENESGEITGFVMDGLPFMSLRKLPVYATPGFNFTLLGFALLIMLVFAIRRFHQRREIALLGEADRRALNGALYVSLAHLVVIISGAVVVSVAMKQLVNGLPPLFKAWLVLPIVATFATIYLLYQTIQVWRAGSVRRCLGASSIRFRCT